MRPILGIIVVALWLLIALTSAARAESVYLRDGGVVPCESFWRKGGLIVVKVNRDVLVEFTRDEVDLTKSMRGKKRTVGSHQRQQGVAAKQGGVQPAAGESGQPGEAAEKPAAAPAASPAKVPAPPGAVTNPAAPAPAVKAPATPEPAPPKPVPAVKPLPLPTPVPAVPQPPMSTTALSLFVGGMVAFVVLMIAAQWKIFEKAGVAGWKCLIPIYNVYLLFIIAGKPGWWLILTLIPLVSIVVYLLAMLSLAGKFSKGPAYGVGLFLLPFVFFPLLAFDGSEYSG